MNQGKVLEIVGARVDLDFSEGKLPDILNAVEVERADGTRLVLEVQQHLGKTEFAPWPWTRLMGLCGVRSRPIAKNPSRCLLEMKCWDACLT